MNDHTDTYNRAKPDMRAKRTVGPVAALMLAMDTETLLLNRKISDSSSRALLASPEKAGRDINMSSATGGALKGKVPVSEGSQTQR